MKRVLSATNTSGISAAPAVEDTLEPSEQCYMEVGQNMKRMPNSVMGSTSLEVVKWKATAAKRALQEFLQVAKRYDDIQDHLTQSELTSMDKVLEALEDVEMGVYITYSDDDM